MPRAVLRLFQYTRYYLFQSALTLSHLCFLIRSEKDSIREYKEEEKYVKWSNFCLSCYFSIKQYFVIEKSRGLFGTEYPYCKTLPDQWSWATSPWPLGLSFLIYKVGQQKPWYHLPHGSVKLKWNDGCKSTFSIFLKLYV